MSAPELDLMIVGTLDCGNCGETLFPTRNDGLYDDDQVIACTMCGTKNKISIGDPDDPGEPEDGAYVTSWICKHGKSDEEECETCELISA